MKTKILKTHRGHAKAVRADVDASQLFGFAMDIENTIRADLARWGAKHARYAGIRNSYHALVRELSLKLDIENDLGLRPE